MIEKGSRVKVHLVMAVDGDVVDNSEVEYVHGEGGLLAGLQEHLEGLEPGEKKQCSVPPEKAYGERNEDRLLRVPPEQFGDDLDRIPVGTIIHGVFVGVECDATVIEINPEGFVLDMNHPLAGKTLEFAVEILSVE